MDHFLNTLHSDPNMMPSNGNEHHHNVQQGLAPDDVSPGINTGFLDPFEPDSDFSPSFRI
jgi:hypothetical protein